MNELQQLIADAEASIVPGNLISDIQAKIMRAQLAVLKAQVTQLERIDE